jgi:TatD DNase family protein
MYLIDTHSHLYQPAFDEDRASVIERAVQANVQKIILPNIDLASIDGMHALVEAFPTVCFPMMGLHPCDVKSDFEEVLATMRAHLLRTQYVAIGETGIDLYWDKSTFDLQCEAFKIQLQWAKEMTLPIVIHARDSIDELIAILDVHNDDQLTGVFHCFTGTLAQAKHIIEYGGFYLGIGGVLTYPKSDLRQVVAELPLDRLVLETDAPYLPPVPHRGKRNESSYIDIVAQHLAKAKNITFEEVVEQTMINSYHLFPAIR